MAASRLKLMHSDDEQEFQSQGDQDTSLPMDRIRRFKDSVHDYIPFGPEICAIIDTPQFQRLRNIKQLGTSYYVWPGAAHNRFEHCLGVAYLSHCMAEHLQKCQPELKITRRDIKCVTMAGLCHDLGHGPWSHVWDGLFIPKALPGTAWQHEDASEMMFDMLIKENNLDIPEHDVTFIKALIAGNPSRCRDRQEKQFLFEIVANKRNGLDVDKFDYIARDTHAMDLRGNLSLTRCVARCEIYTMELKGAVMRLRLIHSARVIDDEICFDIKDANQIYELCYTRFSLHKRIYNHKTAKAIEYMIVDALLAAEPHMKFASDITNPQKYLYLTDDLRARIEASESPELEKARSILGRIHKRDLYKCVDYKVFPWSRKDICEEYFTPEKIVQAALADNGDDPDAFEHGELTADHVIVDLAKMHYGMKDKNPLDYVKFYSKQHPNTSERANLDDISLLMPSVFGEVLLRIYTKEKEFHGLVQAGYRTLLAQMPEPLPDPLDSPEPRELTPPLEFQVPSTPPMRKRPLSRVQSAGARFFSGESDITPSLSQNSFTSVPKNYTGRPQSPTHKKSNGQKREREPEVGSGSPPLKKKRGAH
ncbi:uncharacterized protein FIBRA_02308 [Fibroporia radiculosa]|uniref:HD/PDEase domain-containing protein n=1 Tax=Fibroporia radiculosa TaxID=599839 RepID=J4G1K6_9APHY|nr:uncharacterized protein FIBRA_02308 [Fibroporia radiculosa]CCM00278.1 predicted protein [Fibroporia radiculosa]